MSDTIRAVSPLAGRPIPAMPGLAIAERPMASVVQVAAWPDTRAPLDAALARAGLPASPAPGRATCQDGATALSVGPGAMLIVADRAGIYDTLARVIPVELGTVTDLSHARTALRLAGPRAAWVLAKGVGIDLHDSAFADGHVAITQFGDIGVVLHRASADGWDLYCYRGFAGSLRDALIVAGAPDQAAEADPERR